MLPMFFIFAALFWSGNFLVGKFASQYEVPPFSLNFIDGFCLVDLGTIYDSRNIKKRNYI